MDVEIGEEEALGTALVELGRRAVEERVDVKRHVQLLQVERVGLLFDVGVTGSLRGGERGGLLLGGLLAALGLCGLGGVGVLWVLGLLSLLQIIEILRVLAATPGAVDVACELVGLRAHSVDLVRIDLEAEGAGGVGPSDILGVVLVDHVPHVVNEVQRERVLLADFVLIANANHRGHCLLVDLLAVLMARRLAEGRTHSLLLLCLGGLRRRSLPLLLIVVLIKQILASSDASQTGGGRAARRRSDDVLWGWDRARLASPESPGQTHRAGAWEVGPPRLPSWTPLALFERVSG